MAYWVIVERTGNQGDAFKGSGISPNAWHTLLLKVGEQGDLEAYLLLPGQSVPLERMMLEKDNDWDNLYWQFSIHVHSGTVELDQYQELDFGL